MTNEPQPPAATFRPEDEIDEIFGRGNPNPGRVACPTRDVLVAVSRRELPIDHPVHEHLTKCSPCYTEFRALQQAAAVQAPAPAVRRRWLPFAAAAALVLAISGATLFVIRNRTIGPTVQTSVPTPTAELRMELDLRNYTVLRSDQRQDERPPVLLAHARISITIFLPVGFEPGSYDVQIQDLQLQPMRSTSGQAAIRDFVTTLQATMDLSSMPPGEYRLAVRRQGDEWQTFPAVIK